MNKREIRVAIRQRNAIPDNGSGLAEHDAIDDCIAAALRDISTEARWPWLRYSSSLTFSGNAAAIPADCSEIEALTIDGYPVRFVGIDEFEQQTTSYVFTDDGANVKLYPTPATAPTSPTLVYYRNEPELTTDTASPLLPAAWHQAVVVRGSYHLNVRRMDKDRINLDENEWQGLRARMAHASVRTVGPRQIRSSFRINQWARWS